MTTQEEKPEAGRDVQKRALNKRLESVSWALFLILIGCLWLVPEEQVPKNAWLFGVGIIMLGLNAARFLNGIRMSSFSVILGILAIALGLSDVLGVELPIFPILLVLVGLGIVFDVLFQKGRD